MLRAISLTFMQVVTFGRVQRAMIAVLALASAASGQEAEDPGVLMQPGVSAALARDRTARLADVRYDLSLDLSARDSAAGRGIARFTLRRPGPVILDFRGIHLGPVRANGRLIHDLEYNKHHILIPAQYLRAGANRIDVEFAARIAPSGASIIRVRDPSDSLEYVYTLLVPSDAQQLFPCFDQPDLKARVTLTLTTPGSWTAVSNGTRIRVDTTSRGATFVFRETEPISTYLIAFAAGPWVEKSVASSTRAINLFVRRSRADEVDADSLVLAHERSLTWLERYFDSRYPFQKLDIVLAPAFPFGGMEHPGAIFYSEERFIFRERPTLVQRLGRLSTIYHEVAHQWFGDLATMRWFDDLWLKEGFATFMATKMQSAMEPESEAWKGFYLRTKPAAYAVDGSEGTTPVYQELPNLDLAKSNYGPIVYNKAPSVLKQLEYAVGDRAFQDGVRRFLRRYPYANANWRELLEAIGEAAGRSLREWGDHYILRPGMPVVEQSMETAGGQIVRLRLTQRPARTLSGPAPWPIRSNLMLYYHGGESRRFDISLTTDTASVREVVGLPVPAFAFANSGDEAYGLFLPDSLSIVTLERAIGSVSDAFTRSLLWGALWDAVRETRYEPERFVGLALRELPRERDEQLAGTLLARLTRALGAYVDGALRDSLQSVAESTFVAAARDARRSYGTRRAYLNAFIRVARSPAATEALDGMLDSTMFGVDSLGLPTRWGIVTRLLALGAPRAIARYDSLKERDKSADGARQAFAAWAARPDGSVKHEYFTRYFADTTLNEDWATASLGPFNDVEHDSLTMPFLRASLDSLPWIQKNRRIFFLGAWLGAFVESKRSRAALDVVRQFLAQRTDLGRDLRLKVLQSIDEVERTVAIRERRLAELGVGG
ncbi:MAG TPA: M1 family aminopeptidase [Gemmatimonadaceae bacterium]|nr:M1 family aminopeptidase [Gemmatimonadaceae bacterium]